MKRKYIKPVCNKFALLTEGKIMACSGYTTDGRTTTNQTGTVPSVAGGGLFNAKPATANRIGF